MFDFDCPPGDESAATAAFRKNPCRWTKKQPGLPEAGILSIWFTGGGLWGFDGIRRTAQLMLEAFNEKKLRSDLIVRKG